MRTLRGLQAARYYSVRPPVASRPTVEATQAFFWAGFDARRDGDFVLLKKEMDGIGDNMGVDGLPYLDWHREESTLRLRVHGAVCEGLTWHHDPMNNGLVREGDDVAACCRR